METKDYLIAGILIMVIIVAGIGFLLNFSSSNGGVSIMDDPSISALNSNVSTLLSGSASTSDSQKVALYNDTNPIISSDSFLLTTMISAPKKFFSVFIGLFSVFFNLLSEKLGVSILIISGFISIVLIIVIFSIWRTVKQG